MNNHKNLNILLIVSEETLGRCSRIHIYIKTSIITHDLISVTARVER